MIFVALAFVVLVAYIFLGRPGVSLLYQIVTHHKIPQFHLSRGRGYRYPSLELDWPFEVPKQLRRHAISWQFFITKCVMNGANQLRVRSIPWPPREMASQAALICPLSGEKSGTEAHKPGDFEAIVDFGIDGNWTDSVYIGHNGSAEFIELGNRLMDSLRQKESIQLKFSSGESYEMRAAISELLGNEIIFYLHRMN